MTVHLVIIAHCDDRRHPDCDWTADGDPAAVDRAAERHTKTERHVTHTVGVPERRGR